MSLVQGRPRSTRIETSLVRAPRLDWPLALATGALMILGALLVWSATQDNTALTGGDGNAFLKKQLVNIAIGIVLSVLVTSTDHRWVRILAPLVYCLLYTSPSPRDGLLSRMPSSA